MLFSERPLGQVKQLVLELDRMKQIALLLQQRLNEWKMRAEMNTASEIQARILSLT
ncbi:hypothetical protein D3C79_1120240 [compost metagenome]